MVEVDVYLDKSVEENAEKYFEKSKKLKKKAVGAKKAIEIYTEKLLLLEKKRESEKDAFEEEIKEVDKPKREWFEKFRWFYTSEGFLVIGGRDSTTNEIVVKKQTDSNDIIFHTDLAGSPFFVIKTAGKTVGENSLRETADATVTFSRVFKLGTISSPVFYVKPEQVTKEANSGEYLTKGAFVIKGKVNYIDNRINIAVGKLKDGKLMAAPLESVKANCTDFLELQKGSLKPSEIAKKIRAKLGGNVDDIIRMLPSGEMELKK